MGFRVTRLWDKVLDNLWLGGVGVTILAVMAANALGLFPVKQNKQIPGKKNNDKIKCNPTSKKGT